MKKFLFCSTLIFTDNTLAVFNELRNKHIKGKYVWLCKDHKEVEKGRKLIANSINKGEKIYFVKKNSLLGIYHFTFSNYIFYTHGIFEKISVFPWQKKINLWHGMPLKTIGHYTESSVNFHFDYTIGNSPVFIEPLSVAFGINKEKILKIGSPRNDMIFEKSNFKFNELFFNNYRTIIWMPTFRSDIYSEEIIANYNDDFLSVLSYTEIPSFNDFLSEIKINILIKIHPMDILNENKNIDEINSRCSNIKVDTYKTKLLPDNIYSILSKTDALITDYSSIYFDYLLLGNPVAIVVSDENEYSKNRGFIPEVERKIEGYKIKNLSQLKSFLLNLTDETKLESMKKLTKKQKKVFQKYDNSPNNSEILLKKLKIID